MWNPLKLGLSKVWLTIVGVLTAVIGWLKLRNSRLKGKIARDEKNRVSALQQADAELIQADRQAEQEGKDAQAKEIAEAKSGKRDHFDNDF